MKQLIDYPTTRMSSLQGYLGKRVTPNQIIKRFGPGVGSGDKTNYEWIFEIDGKHWTVYDYKTNIDQDTPYDWHIGGEDTDGIGAFIIRFLEEVGAYVGLKDGR